MWDDHKKQWFITEHHDTKDFRWWLPLYKEDISELLEDEEEDLTIEEQIVSMEEALTLHSEVICDILRDKHDALKEKIEEDYYVEKEETPREEYARKLKELYELYDEDMEAWSNTSRLDPETLAFLDMSDDNKKKMVN